jgi:nuclease S1
MMGPEKMKMVLLAGGLVGMLGMKPVALPFGLEGHRIVAEIAQRHLTEAARGRAIALLGGDDLARVATWADEYRGTPEGRWTASWHYTTLPVGQHYAYTPDDGNTDIGEAIRDQEAVLADPSRPRAERIAALKFVVHFLGDIHQPLHVGRLGDRGGNDVKVQWFGKQTNLHRVWDSGIIRHQELSYTEFVDFVDRVPAEEVVRWQADPVEVWAAESQELREVAYGPLGDSEEPSLGWDYRNEMAPLLDRRLVQGGIRLAGVLNRALGN